MHFNSFLSHCIAVWQTICLFIAGSAEWLPRQMDETINEKQLLLQEIFPESNITRTDIKEWNGDIIECDNSTDSMDASSDSD